jgi:hypothetical protein
MQGSILLSLVVTALGAGPHIHHHEATPPPGKPRCRPHTDERAGHPRCLGHCAAPSLDPTGVGYYVGGGSTAHGNWTRCREDGTWGWDETGSVCLPRRVRLGWNHGGHFADRPGTYATDRPHGPLRRLLPSAREVGN